MALAGEVLEHLRSLVHGQRGPHRGGGWREFGPFLQGTQELFLLRLLVFQRRGAALAAAHKEQRDRRRHPEDRHYPPEGRQGDEEHAEHAQDERVQRRLPVDPRGQVPFRVLASSPFGFARFRGGVRNAVLAPSLRFDCSTDRYVVPQGDREFARSTATISSDELPHLEGRIPRLAVQVEPQGQGSTTGLLRLLLPGSLGPGDGVFATAPSLRDVLPAPCLAILLAAYDAATGLQGAQQ